MRPTGLQQLAPDVRAALNTNFRGEPIHSQVVSPPNRVRGARPDDVQASLGIGTIAHDVTQTDHRIRPLLSLLQGKQRLPIGVNITKDYDARH